MTTLTCGLCSSQKDDLYVCPKCGTRYCSLKCYRSEGHSSCSEKFYRACVESELSGKMADKPIAGLDADPLPGCSAEIPVAAKDGEECYNEASGEEDPWNEDDGDEEDDSCYLNTVSAATKNQISSVDESTIDLQLTSMKVGTDTEQLLATLSAEERKEFEKVLTEFQVEECGLDKSVFAKKIKSE